MGPSSSFADTSAHMAKTQKGEQRVSNPDLNATEQYFTTQPYMEGIACKAFHLHSSSQTYTY